MGRQASLGFQHHRPDRDHKCPGSIGLHNPLPFLPPAPERPGSHLTLQLTLLLEAEVFRSVGHHGEGLLGIVSVGQRVDQALLRANTGNSELLLSLS